MIYLAAGILTGILAGMFGIGGGAILVPLLVYGFRFTQHQAQGTSLAVLLLPVGGLAALQYYRAGQVDLTVAAWLAGGFVLGAAAGSIAANRLAGDILQRGLGVLLLVIALQMIFGRTGHLGS
jgi:hypothetical protein